MRGARSDEFSARLLEKYQTVLVPARRGHINDHDEQGGLSPHSLGQVNWHEFSTGRHHYLANRNRPPVIPIHCITISPKSSPVVLTGRPVHSPKKTRSSCEGDHIPRRIISPCLRDT